MLVHHIPRSQRETWHLYLQMDQLNLKGSWDAEKTTQPEHLLTSDL